MIPVVPTEIVKADLGLPQTYRNRIGCIGYTRTIYGKFIEVFLAITGNSN
jgi:hypothetical protein